MVFESNSQSKFHHISKLDPGPPNVWFMDVFSTAKSHGDDKPLTGSMFLLENSDKNEPAPKYGYDETGVVIQGELHITDEQGNSQKLLPGCTFFIHRGSTITFSTPTYAVAYKAAARVGELPVPVRSKI